MSLVPCKVCEQAEAAGDDDDVGELLEVGKVVVGPKQGKEAVPGAREDDVVLEEIVKYFDGTFE